MKNLNSSQTSVSIIVDKPCFLYFLDVQSANSGHHCLYTVTLHQLLTRSSTSTAYKGLEVCIYTCIFIWLDTICISQTSKSCVFVQYALTQNIHKQSPISLFGYKMFSLQLASISTSVSKCPDIPSLYRTLPPQRKDWCITITVQ